jgi:mono/diheme cytochrome c family protein
MTHSIRPQWICLPLVALYILCGYSFEARAQSKELGKQVFTSIAQPPCMICHTLSAAGATGEIGPNLDKMKPDQEKVRMAVERGVGNMPPFGEILNKEQIDAVSRFVAEAAKK